MKNNVNVLGTEYRIKYNDKRKYLPKYADGCCDFPAHMIRIAKIKPDRDTSKDLEAYRRQVVRHEIIHAFFYESGLAGSAHSSVGAWSMDEEMTDWFAIQSPKIFKAFSEVGCL